MWNRTGYGWRSWWLGDESILASLHHYQCYQHQEGLQGTTETQQHCKLCSLNWVAITYIARVHFVLSWRHHTPLCIGSHHSSTCPRFGCSCIPSLQCRTKLWCTQSKMDEWSFCAQRRFFCRLLVGAPSPKLHCCSKQGIFGCWTPSNTMTRAVAELHCLECQHDRVDCI